MPEVVCPYCNDLFEEDLTEDFRDGDDLEIHCDYCGKNFMACCSISYHFHDERKVDCLNGVKDHIWVDSTCFPKIIKKKIKQHCKMCFKEHHRLATEQEISKELEDLKDYPGLQQITLGTPIRL